jgi:predicted RNase H-like nuclease (RuvC/YqgF family)
LSPCAASLSAGRRNKDYARFENLKYEEKSREEIAAMHDAEVKERYREKNEKQVLEYQAMVDKLKKDRENLESTLEETKRTLEKKEAEERDISRKKTEKELLQAKVRKRWRRYHVCITLIPGSHAKNECPSLISGLICGPLIVV